MNNHSTISIPIAYPSIGKEEIKAVTKVLRTGLLTSGETVRRFEKDFASYIGTKYAAAVTNGTVALYLALLSCGIGPGDEVITTPFTFAATAEAIIWAGAKVVFVDIDPVTLNIGPNNIAQAITKKTKAIIPVHLYGQPADMQKILEIGRKYKILVIEDCAQAVGAEVKLESTTGSTGTTGTTSLKNSRGTRDTFDTRGTSQKNWKKVGTIGDVGCFSFYATKNMTTGEGGMITTNSKKIYEKCLLLRNHGSRKRYHHQILGANFRLTEMQAAMGITQLQKLDQFNQKRQNHAAFLTKNLSNIKGIITPTTPPQKTHVYHLYTVRITPDFTKTRDKFVYLMRKKGIEVDIYYPILLPKQQFIRKYFRQTSSFRKKFPYAEKAAREVVSLPVHPKLRISQLKKVVSTIRDLAS